VAPLRRARSGMLSVPTPSARLFAWCSLTQRICLRVHVQLGPEEFAAEVDELFAGLGEVLGHAKANERTLEMLEAVEEALAADERAKDETAQVRNSAL
jgi:hypothetical protein